MQLTISIDDLTEIKRDLFRAHPEISSTRRVEAAARGLGVKSYASLRAALSAGPIEVVPNDLEFVRAAGVARSEPSRALSRAIARTAVRKVMERHPTITGRGFDTIFPRFPDERKLTWPERRAALAKRREDTLTDYCMDEFELAWIYLAMQKRRKTINFDFGSYGLKHRAENLSRVHGQFTHLGNYVENGMLIIAALASGLEAKQIDDGPNACFNLSSKSIRETAGHPIMSRSEQGRLLAFALASMEMDTASSEAA